MTGDTTPGAAAKDRGTCVQSDPQVTGQAPPSGPTSETSALGYVVDGVTDGLEVFKIFILNTEVGDTAAKRLFERLNKFDQCERISFQVVNERMALGDTGCIHFEDVRKTIADGVEDLITGELLLIGHAASVPMTRRRVGASPQSPAEMAAPMRPTTLASTMSQTTKIAFTITMGDENPCEMMHTPSVPSNIAPPYVSGSREV
jgi:hypothetical protein